MQSQREDFQVMALSRGIGSEAFEHIATRAKLPLPRMDAPKRPANVADAAFALSMCPKSLQFEVYFVGIGTCALRCGDTR